MNQYEIKEVPEGIVLEFNNVVIAHGLPQDFHIPALQQLVLEANAHLSFIERMKELTSIPCEIAPIPSGCTTFDAPLRNKGN